MGQRIATLVSKGDVALFIATPGALNIQPRIDGAVAAIKQSGKPINPKVVATDADLSKELTAIDSYYLGHNKLAGMFAVDAGDTQGVGQIIQKHIVPEQHEELLILRGLPDQRGFHLELAHEVCPGVRA